MNSSLNTTYFYAELLYYDHNTKLTLLQLLEDRYGKRATIITSQLPVKSWYQWSII